MKLYAVNIRVRETRTLLIRANSKGEAMLTALRCPDEKHTTTDREISVGQIRDSDGNIV